MTLLEVEELTRYWIDHPPLHLMFAAYLGFGMTRNRRAGSITPQDEPAPRSERTVGQLLAELGPAFADGDVHAGLGPVLLDFEELRRRSGRELARQDGRAAD